ncbi:glycosyl hydrolases family 18-domain-containing protein [Kickxella alabastrina]|uniref:glycosyl hydrolases family 18-domain-containing protein n=1 Tax=Kickxella alabastrina TaxID=61397 RepID=UPI00221FB008|nr:glycosyl hydrolases family 18-domain-containing protein [Kickxella alabastrina]KAI7823442.1 glycosyl hydrolases family 18-domain-containing protein [Kickxella alabastrina]
MHMLLNIAGLALGMFTQVLGRPMIIGYYPSWKRARMANVDFSKYAHINLSFGIPTAEGTFSYEGDWFLAQTVADIHSKGAKPFDVTGGPLKDIAAFAKVVDYANLMQYDINSSWNAETGPNAPFNFEQGKGIGYYGWSTTAKVDMTKDPNNQYQPQESVVPLGDSEDAAWYDACAGTTSNSGTWMWKHLCNQGVLSSPSTAAAPWVRQWDPVSQTPWLFNPTTKQLILYDDPQSIKIKVDYAAAKGLGGTMIWSINMDYNNKLIDVIHSWNIGGPPINTTISADSSTAAVPTASNTATITTTITVTPSKHYPTVTIINGSGNSGETPVPGSSCLFNKVHKCAKISGKDDGYNVSLWHMGGSIMR